MRGTQCPVEVKIKDYSNKNDLGSIHFCQKTTGHKGECLIHFRTLDLKILKELNKERDRKSNWI